MDCSISTSYGSILAKPISVSRLLAEPDSFDVARALDITNLLEVGGRLIAIPWERCISCQVQLPRNVTVLYFLRIWVVSHAFRCQPLLEFMLCLLQSLEVEENISFFELPFNSLFNCNFTYLLQFMLHIHFNFFNYT